MDTLHFSHLLLFIALHAVVVSVNAVDPPFKINILDFGAVGDGKTDDTQAFAKAWGVVCSSNAAYPTMSIPEGKTYLLNPLKFQGPCKATGKVCIMIEGTIVAPDSPSTWSQLDPTKWLEFISVFGLLIDGSGTIDGRGYNWWRQSCRLNPKPGCTSFAPTAMSVDQCTDVELKNIKLRDSPQTHILIVSSQRVYTWNLNIMSPGDSPNTDGIHIQGAEHVMIQKGAIGTGDDCISIGDRIFDVKIDRISCGPGHGISVGSLGRGGLPVSVEQVSVKYSNFFNTTNGARIKTWQGGSGYAKSISFEHLNFFNVDNPIIIDQHYCDVANKCGPQDKAVKISEVTYANIWGTTRSSSAISLNCSELVGCEGIHLNQINLTAVDPAHQQVGVNCINAHGDTHGYIHPTASCLQPQLVS